MTLFRNFAVLRQQCGNPFAPIQILTGDTRKPCGSRRGRLHDECRSLQLQSCIDRRFESSPESRGSQTSGVLLVLFVHAKRIKPFSLSGLIRGFANLKSAHPNNYLAQTKLNPFETFRGSANLDSARRSCGFALTKLNPFAASRQCPCRDSTLRVLFSPPLAASFFVAAATNLCASRYYRRLCRLCNFPMESSPLRDARSACISRRPRRH